MGPDGSDLAAALYYLGQHAEKWDTDAEGIYSQVANRVSELIGGVQRIEVDQDEKRELLTVFLRDLEGTDLPAHALSDGTLRFLALAVIELDPRGGGLICMEEPGNGIHPERVPAMVRLLQDIATDVEEPVGQDNPLRQVIVNTHSPAVVAAVPEDSLLVAASEDVESGGHVGRTALFSCLSGTWRAHAPADTPTVPKGRLMAYLNPAAAAAADAAASAGIGGAPAGTRRVSEREDLQLLLPLGWPS